MKLILAAALFLCAKANAQIITINENLDTSSSTFLFNTNIPQLDIATDNYSGAIPNVALFVGSNVVVGTGNGSKSQVVFYATGTIDINGQPVSTAPNFTGISSSCAAGYYLSTGTWVNGVTTGGGCVLAASGSTLFIATGTLTAGATSFPTRNQLRFDSAWFSGTDSSSQNSTFVTISTIAETSCTNLGQYVFLASGAYTGSTGQSIAFSGLASTATYRFIYNVNYNSGGTGGAMVFTVNGGVPAGLQGVNQTYSTTCLISTFTVTINGSSFEMPPECDNYSNGQVPGADFGQIDVTNLNGHVVSYSVNTSSVSIASGKFLASTISSFETTNNVVLSSVAFGNSNTNSTGIIYAYQRVDSSSTFGCIFPGATGPAGAPGTNGTNGTNGVSFNGGWTATVPTGQIYVTTAANTVTVQSTFTVEGNAFSVGGSTFVVSGGYVGIGGLTLTRRNLMIVPPNATGTPTSIFAASDNIFYTSEWVVNQSSVMWKSNLPMQITANNASTPQIFINASNNILLGTLTGTQIYRCSGGSAADSGALLYGNSGVSQTACTVGGGTLTGVGVFLP